MTANGGVAAAGSNEGNVSPPNSETGMRRMVVNDREIRQAAVKEGTWHCSDGRCFGTCEQALVRHDPVPCVYKNTDTKKLDPKCPKI